MFNKFVFFSIVSALLFSACGIISGSATKEPQPVKSNLPSLTGAWTINMTHSGGIMGLLRSIEITSTGSYTVKDERGNQNISGQLSEEELANLIQVINSTTYSQYNKPYGCADCFIYDIEIAGDDGRFSAQVDDISIEESGLSALVTSLREIMERELK
ncbi:MAG: hypothetical protein JNM55_06095 [Anaerolineales bacterium]|nr:hypothetical protein [Anaerolineales bacterium]